MKAGALFIAAMVLSVPAHASDAEPICADRPGKANPSCIVPRGQVQVETGLFEWSRERSGGVRTDETAIGATAVKFGLSDRLHVEFDLAPYMQVRAAGGGIRERASGFGDLGMAIKYRLTSDQAPVQASVYPFVKFPTAKRPLGNRKLEGGAALLVDGDLGGSGFGWNIAPEADVLADSDGRGHHLGMVQVVSLGAGLSKRLSAAVDLWGSWDWDPAGTVRQFSIGPSAAYLLSNDLQLDAGLDLGLNRNTPDVQLYAGVALRF